MERCHGQVLGKVVRLFRFRHFLYQTQPRTYCDTWQHSLGCASLKNLREGHGLAVSRSLQEIKIRGQKHAFVFNAEKSCVFASPKSYHAHS